MAGLVLGIRVHNRLSDSAVRSIILALLSGAGCLLLSRGSILVLAATVTGLVICVACIWCILVSLHRRKPPPPTAVPKYEMANVEVA